MTSPVTLAGMRAIRPRPWYAAAAVPALLMAVHATNDAFTGMLAALLPTLQERFGLAEATLALFVATLSFSSSMLQPLLGGVADRVGSRTMVVIGIITSSVLLSLIAVAPSPFVLFALLLFGGLGSAAFHPAGTGLVRKAGEGFKELAVALFSSGGTLGMALGPTVILLLARSVGLRFAPLLMIPGVLLGVLVLLVVRRDRSPRPPVRIKFLDPTLVMSPVGLLSLAGVLRSLAFVTFVNSVPLWLHKVHGYAVDASVIALSLALYGIASGVGGVIAGAMAKRFRPRAIIVTSMLLALPLFLSVLWIAPGTVLYYLVVTLAGAASNAPVPLLIVSAQDLAPGSMGAATGMLMGFTWGSAGVLYIGIGFLQEWLGLSQAMAIGFIGLVPATLIVHLVLSRNRAGVIA